MILIIENDPKAFGKAMPYRYVAFIKEIINDEIGLM